MKTFATFVKFGLIGALLAAPMFAQTSANIRVDVPFPFYVGQQALPAGTYTLKADAASSLMIIRDNGTGQTTLTVTWPSPTVVGPAASELHFRVYGKTRYLSGIWMPGTAGLELWKSPAEREVARSHGPYEVAVVTTINR